MTLIQTIKDDQLTARKKRDTATATSLTTLIGEADMIGKNDGNRETADDEVIALVRKFIKGNNEILANADNATNVALTAAKDEIALLEQYLPTQLSDEELRTAISDIIRELESPTMRDMGKIMAQLKTNHDGSYEGGAASKIVRFFLTGK